MPSTTADITPESFDKRSFVYRQHPEATWLEVAGGAMTSNAMLDDLSDHGQIEKPTLLDFSMLPRVGFRGAKAAEIITTAGLPLPKKPNQACESASGEWVLRLSQKEYWVLGALQDKGNSIEALSQQDLPGSGCHRLYCQDSHAWFLLRGGYLAEIMAKLCGVDLRTAVFPLGAIVQSSAARINVIIVRQQLGNAACFSILCDSASAEYLWDCLQDAMQEYQAIEEDAVT